MFGFWGRWGCCFFWVGSGESRGVDSVFCRSFEGWYWLGVVCCEGVVIKDCIVFFLFGVVVGLFLLIVVEVGLWRG